MATPSSALPATSAPTNEAGHRSDLLQFGDFITLQRKDEDSLSIEWLGAACYPVVPIGGAASKVAVPHSPVSAGPGASAAPRPTYGPLDFDRRVFSIEPWSSAVPGSTRQTTSIDPTSDPAARYVTYGQTVCLLNVFSNRYLCCVDVEEGGDVEVQLHRPKNMPAMVDETGSVHRHQWRLMPRNKGREQEGGCVRRFEQVHILNVACGLFLNIDSLPQQLSEWAQDNDERIRSIGLVPPLRDLAGSVAVDRGACPWTVVPHDMEVANHGGKFVRALDPVVVFHREAEGFMEALGHEDGVSSDVWLDLRPTGRATYDVLSIPHSTNALWTIEADDPTKGGALLFQKERYRVKHVCTGRYLTFRVVEGELQRQKVVVGTTRKPNDEDSLLCFHPIDSGSTQEAEMSRTVWCRIQFAVSGRFLHSKSPTDAEPDMQATDYGEIEHSKGRRALDAVLKGYTEDVFAIRVAPVSDREAVLTARQVVPVLKCFTKYWRESAERREQQARQARMEPDGYVSRQKRELLDEAQHQWHRKGVQVTKETAAVFQSLIRFLSDEPMRPQSDPAVDALPQPHLTLQRMLFHSHIHDLIFDCLRGPVESGVSLDDVSRPSSHTSFRRMHKDDRTQHRAPDDVCQALYQVYRVGFRLVGQMVRGSKDLAVRVRDHIPFLERQLRHDELNIASALMQIISDNKRILEDLRSRQLEFFCFLIPQYGRSAKYFELLSACCVCEGEAIPGNQTTIARCLGGPDRPDTDRPLKLKSEAPSFQWRWERPCYVHCLRVVYPLQQKRGTGLLIKPYTTFPPSLPARVSRFLKLYEQDRVARETGVPAPVDEVSSSESSLSSAATDDDVSAAALGAPVRDSSSENSDDAGAATEAADHLISPRELRGVLYQPTAMRRRRNRRKRDMHSWEEYAENVGEGPALSPGQGCWVWICELPAVHGCDKWRSALSVIGSSPSAPELCSQWRRQWLHINNGYLYFSSAKAGHVLRQLAAPEIVTVHKGGVREFNPPEQVSRLGISCVLKSAAEARPCQRKPRVMICCESMYERNELLSELRRAVGSADRAIEDTKALSGDPIFAARSAQSTLQQKTTDSLHGYLKSMLRKQRASRTRPVLDGEVDELILGPSVRLGERHDCQFDSLSSFVRYHAANEEVDYLQAQLNLFSSLCLGNNAAALSWLQRVLPREAVLEGIVFSCDDRRAPCLRAAFADLTVNLWLRPDLPKEKSGAPDKQVAARHAQFLSSLRAAVAEHLGRRSQKVSGTNRQKSIRTAHEHRFTAAILRVCEQLIECGADCDFAPGGGNYTLSELELLLPPLLRTLKTHYRSGKKDSAAHRQQQQQQQQQLASVVSFDTEQNTDGMVLQSDRPEQDGQRTRPMPSQIVTDEERALLEAKLQTCRVFMQLFDDARTCDLIKKVFRGAGDDYQASAKDPSDQKRRGSEASADAHDRRGRRGSQEGVGGVGVTGSHQVAEVPDDLTCALLETLLCRGNDTLFVTAVRLIFRHLSQKFSEEAERDIEAHRRLASILLPCVLPKARHRNSAVNLAPSKDLSGREEIIVALFRLLDGSVTDEAAALRRSAVRISGAADPTVNGVYRLGRGKHDDRYFWTKKQGSVIRYLFYSTKNKKWHLSDALGDGGENFEWAESLSESPISKPGQAGPEWGNVSCTEETSSVSGVVLAVMTTLTELINLNRPLPQKYGPGRGRPASADDMAYVQCQLDRLKLSPLVLQLIESRAEVVVQYSLQLMIAMMTNGNSQVQNSLSNYFLSRNDEALFSTMRSRMAQAVKQVQEAEKERGFDRLDQYQTTKLHHIHDVLRVLQLFSEGHNELMQDYLRAQPDNVVSYNLVQETFSLLQTLLTIDPQDTFTRPIVVQAFSTMTEFCQGPCRGNQEQLIKSNIATQLNCVLAQDFNGVTRRDMNEVRSAALVCVHAVLEGLSYSDPFVAVIRCSVDRDTCRRVVAECWVDRIHDETDDANDIKSSLGVAFNVVILLKMINCGGWLEGVIGDHYLSRMVGRIEICREGRLERVYFRVPRIVSNLSEETKDDLLRSVNRDTPTARISDFFDRTEGLICEIEYYNKLFRGPRDGWIQELVQLGQAMLHRWSELLQYSVFAVAVVANVALLMHASWPEGEDKPTVPAHMHVPLKLLALVQLLVCVCVISDFWVSKAPLIVFRYQKRENARKRRQAESKQSSRDMLAWWEADREQGRPADARPGRARPGQDMQSTRRKDRPGVRMDDEITRFLMSPPPATVVLRCLRYETAFLMHVACCLTAFLAVVYSPFFLSFHLLSVSTRNQTLHNVIRAVTSQGGTLLVTALLAGIIIWYFTLLCFTLFRDKFGQREGDSDNVHHCDDLSSCYHYLLSQAVRAGGGVGDLTSGHDWTASPLVLSVGLLSDFFFFVLIQVILLNIMSGVIIDTFTKSREDKERIEADIRGSCFICGIESTQFDRQTEGGFESHVKGDHNMWCYIYFLHHLREKDPVTFTGPESFVYQQIQQHDLSFFPLNKAIALEGKRDDDDLLQDVPETEQELQTLLSTVKIRLADVHQQWYKQYSEHKQQVRYLCESAVRALNDQEKLSGQSDQSASAAVQQASGRAVGNAAARGDALKSWRCMACVHLRRLILSRGRPISFEDAKPGMRIVMTPEGCLVDHEFYYGTVIRKKFVQSEAVVSPAPRRSKSPQKRDARDGFEDVGAFEVFQVGVRVRHQVRGEGEVVCVVPDAEGSLRAHVYFDSGETHRYLAKSLHKLEIVSRPRRISVAALARRKSKSPDVDPTMQAVSPVSPTSASSTAAQGRQQQAQGDYYIVVLWDEPPRVIRTGPGRLDSVGGGGGPPTEYEIYGEGHRPFPRERSERQEWWDGDGKPRVLPEGATVGSSEFPKCPITSELRTFLLERQSAELGDMQVTRSPRRCLPPPPLHTPATQGHRALSPAPSAPCTAAMPSSFRAASGSAYPPTQPATVAGAISPPSVSSQRRAEPMPPPQLPRQRSSTGRAD
eukprot:TRINITY_DN5763_c0_g1_i1.p1 TRINITY_DN5763_c0_g1~~TRINITY_DN5763_c0_g1_i1.p1  ORF type:complete len:2981 (+),score=515.22 TRINITY_DN5763_c0_g1_i1:142-9084(+)